MLNESSSASAVARFLGDETLSAKQFAGSVSTKIEDHAGTKLGHRLLPLTGRHAHYLSSSAVRRANQISSTLVGLRG